MTALRSHTLLIVSLSLTASAAFAQQPVEHLGEHPAVLIQRQVARAGYDYASKFYPHPAWMYLSAEAPRPMMEHPAVIVARRERERIAKHDAAPALVEDRLARAR